MNVTAGTMKGGLGAAIRSIFTLPQRQRHTPRRPMAIPVNREVFRDLNELRNQDHLAAYRARREKYRGGDALNLFATSSGRR